MNVIGILIESKTGNIKENDSNTCSNYKTKKVVGIA